MRVTLYDGDRAIGRVQYTANLDHWDGNNYTSGSTGCHLGCGKTTDGRYYLCYGTQWSGQRDRAEIVSETEAQETVLANDADEYAALFGEPVPVLSE